MAQHPLAFQIGSFDITKYSDNELWARMTAFSRLYSGMEEDFRLLAYSNPYPLEGAVDNLRHLMAGTGDPLTRERLAAYRRFIEELVETSSLKTTNYYLLVFSDKAPRIVANTLEGGLRLPVWPRPTLPPLTRTLYREGVLHIHPADDTLEGHPLIAFLYSYDLRGNVDFSLPINFLRLPCPLAMAIDVQTVHPNKVMTKLSRAYNALKADVMGRTGNEAPDAEKEQAFLDVQEAMALVTNERAGLHQVGLGFAVMGHTRDELEENVEMVHSTATRSQVSLRRAFGHQKQAMGFFLPQKVDAAIREEYRSTMSPGLACLTPFGYEVRKDIRGPFIAVNVSTGSPFFLSKFDLPAYNEINLGRTGSGKTFAALLRAYRETMFGIQTVFIDPQGNGLKVTQAVDGSYNYLKLGVESAINVMDVVQENLMAQVSHVIVMLESILRRELAIEEKNGVDAALVDLYGRLDPTREFDAADMPLLEDLACRLEAKVPTLAKDLERFVEGTLRDTFNRHTTINLNLDRRYPIITYDLQDVEGEFRPTFVFALLSSIERVIRRRKHLQLPTNIILDEFGILSEIESIAKAAGLLAKRVRAWKVGIQTLDQNWDTYRTPAGRKIVENALIKVILRVDDTAVPEICSALNLTEHHRDIMLSAGLGEGILIAENKAYHVYFQASKAELEMLTPYKKKKTGGHVLDLPLAQPAVVEA